MADAEDLAFSAFQKVWSQKLDEYLEKRKVSPEARDAITNSFEMMVEYIPYAAKQGKSPSDGKVLAEFLLSKGEHGAKYLGIKNLNCGLAIVDLLKSGNEAIASTTGPQAAFIPLPVLAWGLATLDLISVGNNCEFVQSAYYQAFLKSSDYVIKRSDAAVQSMRLP